MSICDQRLNAAASLPSSVFRLNSEWDVTVIRTSLLKCWMWNISCDLLFSFNQVLQNNQLLITALILNIMGLLFHDLAFVEYLKQHRHVSKVKTCLCDATSRELTVITSCCFLMFFSWIKVLSRPNQSWRSLERDDLGEFLLVFSAEFELSLFFDCQMICCLFLQVSSVD